MKVEKKYETLKNGKLEEQLKDEWAYARINEIDKKISLGLMTVEEVDEREELNKTLEGKDRDYLKGLDRKKLEKIQKNMPKVENLFEIKEQIKEQMQTIKGEIVNRFSPIDQFTNSEYSDKTNEELAKIYYDLGIKSSMCNEAIRGLLDGKAISNIELDKNVKDKKFNSDEEIYNILKFQKEIKQDIEEKALLEISEFEQKHPKLAKIINWVKTKFWKKTTNKPTLEDLTTNNAKFVNIPKGLGDFAKLLRLTAEKPTEEEKI